MAEARRTVHRFGFRGAFMRPNPINDRFPRLRAAFLEGNCGWVPWLLRLYGF